MGEKSHLYLRYLKIVDDPSLENIPDHLPSTTEINLWFIGKRGTAHSNDRLYHMQSFGDFPKILPNLKEICFHNSNLTNFEDLISEMPKLERIRFSDCSIHNFRGFPLCQQKLFLYHSTINSFEGLELPVPHNNKEMQLYLENCTIHSFAGISRSTIQTILITILSMDHDKYSKQDIERLKKKSDNIPLQVRINLDLTPTGRKLLLESINPEIERAYSPKFNHKWPLPSSNPDNPQYFPQEFNGDEYYETRSDYMRANIIHSNEWHFINEEGYPDCLPNKDEWIYGFKLTEKLFIPEKLDRLHEYYRKTTRQLAQEYIFDTKRLPPEQIERLIHEIDPEIRKLLENNLPVDNIVINQISTKFSFETPNGLKILK